MTCGDGENVMGCDGVIPSFLRKHSHDKHQTTPSHPITLSDSANFLPVYDTPQMPFAQRHEFGEDERHEREH